MWIKEGVKAWSPELAEGIALERKAVSALPAVRTPSLHCRVKQTFKIKFLSVTLCSHTALLISKHSFAQALRNAATLEVERSNWLAASNGLRKKAASPGRTTGQQLHGRHWHSPARRDWPVSEVQNDRLGALLPKRCGVCDGSYWQPGSPSSCYAYHFFHPLLSCSPHCTAAPPLLPVAAAQGFQLNFSKNCQSGSTGFWQVMEM